jgi:hypothetical protein
MAQYVVVLHADNIFSFLKMVEENRVSYVHTEFGEGVTVQLNKILNTYI